jgi:DNA-binding HxlR family transcriptional regulator
MANKTYNQYCAIAHTLDAVGERWTLLAVRNLLVGPKRFSDLIKGLPGISTNILTERLKVLEEHGIVTTRFLPPPAASTVYQLTERGYALVDALTALARWGSHTLGKPQAGQLIVPEAIAFMVMGVFQRDQQVSHPLTCHVHVKDEGIEHRFGVLLSAQGVNLDEALLQADISLHLGLEALSALSSGRARLKHLIEADDAHVEGSQAAVQALLQWVDNG